MLHAPNCLVVSTADWIALRRPMVKPCCTFANRHRRSPGIAGDRGDPWRWSPRTLPGIAFAIGSSCFLSLCSFEKTLPTIHVRPDCLSCLEVPRIQTTNHTHKYHVVNYHRTWMRVLRETLSLCFVPASIQPSFGSSSSSFSNERNHAPPVARHRFFT